MEITPFRLTSPLTKIPPPAVVRGSPSSIPNTEVKPFSADGTWLVTARESRSPPDSKYNCRISGSYFVISRRTAISVGAAGIAGASARRLLRLTHSGRFLLRRIAHRATASLAPQIPIDHLRKQVIFSIGISAARLRNLNRRTAHLERFALLVSVDSLTSFFPHSQWSPLHTMEMALFRMTSRPAIFPPLAVAGCSPFGKCPTGAPLVSLPRIPKNRLLKQAVNYFFLVLD